MDLAQQFLTGVFVSLAALGQVQLASGREPRGLLCRLRTAENAGGKNVLEV